LSLISTFLISAHYFSLILFLYSFSSTFQNNIFPSLYIPIVDVCVCFPETSTKTNSEESRA
jgi:hypothetical protein